MITKEDLAPKIANFTGVCMVGRGAQTCPHHINAGKSFASDVSLILRRSFQWCCCIFPDWSMSKVEKPWKGLFEVPSVLDKFWRRN